MCLRTCDVEHESDSVRGAPHGLAEDHEGEEAREEGVEAREERRERRRRVLDSPAQHTDTQKRMEERIKCRFAFTVVNHRERNDVPGLTGRVDLTRTHVRMFHSPCNPCDDLTFGVLPIRDCGIGLLNKCNDVSNVPALHAVCEEGDDEAAVHHRHPPTSRHHSRLEPATHRHRHIHNIYTSR